MIRQFNYDSDFRKRQIDTLKIFNHNVQEVVENEKYLVNFLSAGRLLSITVYLGPNFPNDKPRITINPAIQHQWCGDGKTQGEILSAPGLINYTPHSDLGRIVQAIIREYEKYPPQILNESSSPVSNNDEGSTPQDHGTANNDCSIPEFNKLSLDELKKLDSDPQFFDDFIEELSVVQALNDELDSMITEVETISKQNQSKEDHLNDMKNKLKNDFHTLRNLGDKYEKLNQKYQKKSEEFAPQHIKELLQIAVSNADSECEKHVEQFLGGKIDVQTFLNRYTESKKISAIRKAKEERLAHQLNAMERAAL